MEHFYKNIIDENWFTYPNLYTEVINLCDKNSISHFVEVGSWKGKSACYMAVEIINSKKNIKFDCVDCWLDEEVYKTFINNIEPVKMNIKVIKSFSNKIVNNYNDNSLDFVFIDAHHSYESVKEDINLWYSKIKIGGIIAGHDFWDEYDSNYNADVNKAVFDYFNFDFYSTNEGCWIHKKNRNIFKKL